MSNSINIRTAIIQGIIDIGLPYPIKWPNAPFETPTNETWLRPTIIMGSPSQVGLEKTDRIDGFIQFDVFTPISSGDLKVYEVADTIRQALPNNGQSLTSGGVVVRFEGVGISGAGSSLQSGSSVQSGAWYTAMIEARFYAYIDRTA